jgi:hypothetical protein
MLLGCATPYSEAPLATNFPTSTQKKLQAAAHWNVIARDVATAIASSLKGTDTRSLFVNQSSIKTPFERAFSNQLLSELVAAGFTVLKTPDGASVVDIDTQAIRFSPNRPQYKYAGLPTALATGVWALHEAEATAGAAAFVVVASADAYAWFRSEFATGETPQTEIVITTSVSNANRYLARSTNVYYVADSDEALYRGAPAQAPTRTLKMTGGE